MCKTLDNICVNDTALHMDINRFRFILLQLCFYYVIRIIEYGNKLLCSQLSDHLNAKFPLCGWYSLLVANNRKRFKYLLKVHN